MKDIQVAVIVGSDSDLKVMESCLDILKDFEITYEFKIMSAHRSPELLQEYMKDSQKRGCKVYIAGAGFAAHLAGVIASKTVCPVIGVPIDSSPLKGLDALLSTVQMPGGIPVATTTIGKSGGKNAALLAIQILGTSNDELKEKLVDYKKKMADKIAELNK